MEESGVNTTDIADGIPGRRRSPARRRVAAAAACALAVLTAVAGCGSAPSTLAAATPTSTLSTGPTSSVATSPDATAPADPSATVGADGSSGPRAQAGSVTPRGSGGLVPAAPPGPVVTTGAGSLSGSAPQAPNTSKPKDPPQAGGGSSVGGQPPVKPHTVAPQPPRGGVGSPAGGNGSGPALASPIRVPLPTDSISSQPFETAKTFLEPQIRAACGDDSLCVQVAAKADPDAGPGQECVGSAENTDFGGGGGGTVTVPRGGTIFLLIDAFCADQPVALARTNVEHSS
jgi:hypothetical protein